MPKRNLQPLGSHPIAACVRIPTVVIYYNVESTTFFQTQQPAEGRSKTEYLMIELMVSDNMQKIKYYYCYIVCMAGEGYNQE